MKLMTSRTICERSPKLVFHDFSWMARAKRGFWRMTFSTTIHVFRSFLHGFSSAFRMVFHRWRRPSVDFSRMHFGCEFHVFRGAKLFTIFDSCVYSPFFILFSVLQNRALANASHPSPNCIRVLSEAFRS